MELCSQPLRDLLSCMYGPLTRICAGSMQRSQTESITWLIKHTYGAWSLLMRSHLLHSPSQTTGAQLGLSADANTPHLKALVKK